MSAAAKLLQDDGWTVTGSDENFYPPTSTYVEKLGIQARVGFRPENIPEGVSLIVLGKNAKLSPETNAEVKSALELGVSVKSAAEVIGEISASAARRLVVAGSFGKSTTTALVAWVLKEAGKNPGYFIGAMPLGMDHTADKGGGEFFVLEGDEYPSAHDDNRAKFLHYRPHDVLLTSLRHDHVNIYPTLESYEAPFRQLTHTLKEDGLLVACLDNGDLSGLLAETRAHTTTYSIANGWANWRARDLWFAETSEFTLMRAREPIASFDTPLLGVHNVQNIIGAAAYLLERELVTLDELRRGVASFRGIARRLDKKTTGSKVPAFEGFGSSNEKAHSAIEAMRAHFPDRRLVVVFEPHTFSWRNRATAHWYDTTFKDVPELLIYHSAGQGKNASAEISADEILARLQKAGVPARAATTSDQILEMLQGTMQENDVMLLLTSGSMDGLIEKIPSWLDERFA